jgi:SAM-dependent methyltransferase
VTSTVETTRGACPLCGFDYSGLKLGCGPDFEYRTTGFQEFCFIKCGTCGILVLDPRPVDEAIHRLYPEEYEPYRFSRLPLPVRLARDFVQRRKADAVLSRAPQSGVLVDVGCGAGTLLRSLRARSGSRRLTLIGWDYPAPHLDALRDDGFAVIAAPIEQAHLPTDVNVFVLNQVIEHVPDPARILTMLRSAMAPDGVIVIETPNTDSMDARLFHARYWGGYHIPRHLTLFDSVNLKTLLGGEATPA